MSLSDDEFGGVDEDDLIQVATQLEQCAPPSSAEFPTDRSPKRRRLNSPGWTGHDAARKPLPLGRGGNLQCRRVLPGLGNQDGGSRLQYPSTRHPNRALGSFWQKSEALPSSQADRSPSGSQGLERRVEPMAKEAGGEADDQSQRSIQSGQPGPAQNEAIEIMSQEDYAPARPRQFTTISRPVQPQGNLRQTTLHGSQAEGQNPKPQIQTKKSHNWPLANKNEAPTHHELDAEELCTWVYPINLGQIRTYQYNIVARGLYHNLLVALPTGLGKTFIAAAIMLNWYRWTKFAQIVFVAPTKPLVSQQVEACFHIAGIPRSATTMLTGTTPPGLRAEEWNSKRVFFMTPQTIVNDLKTGICDPKRLVLIVVDEAHRATGAYAYVEVIKFLRRFNSSFRVLALTATPGSTVEGVQEVIDGLGISRVEIRTEESLDIRDYVHPRNVDTMIFENSDEMVMLMDMYSKTLQPLVDKLRGMNAYWAKDPMTLTPYGTNQARTKWMLSDAGRNANMGVKGMVNAVFTILAKLAHPIDLLKFHGIGPFYHNLEGFQTESENETSKYRKKVVNDESFRKMMSMVQGWLRDKNFVGHPKLEYLQSVVLTHFVDASEGRADSDISPAHTRIMVFAHFRDSAEEIVRVLKRNEPMIRPHVFVGQAAAKGSEGMDQKRQLDIISKFKSGVYNTLVATSIGEEGLDIGEVDLIICYDASASPIRMLQRMGRTGRKRAGNIVVTLMKGKEENSFLQAKDNYQKMQRMIAEGSRFTYHDDLAPRIVPKGVEPVVDKKVIEIPVENTQADLPEPKKRGRPPKRPPKKFHMPDNARTGFTKASRLADPREGDESDEDGQAHHAAAERRSAPTKARSPSIEPLPPLEKVLLSDAQEKELDRLYLQVAGDGPVLIETPRLDAYPSLQRRERPTSTISHSAVTKRTVRTLKSIHKYRNAATQNFTTKLDAADKAIVDAQFEAQANSAHHANRRAKPTMAGRPQQHTASGPKPTQRPISDAAATSVSEEDDFNDDDELAGFIDDDGSPDPVQNVASSLSPPSIAGDKEKPFYESPKLFSQESVELPSVNDLLGELGPTHAGKGRPCHEGAGRRAKRKILDSDDEE